MPPPIPDRYKLEMRLGRDGDIEEWLATDVSLERPVLIRSLGPESTADRRASFITSVSTAAKASHPHLARVFAVEAVEGGVYSVSEWTGGANLADRIGAGRTVELGEFLPNAAGLSGALSALHAAGATHGHVDLSAISYSSAHPAKLGAFGRPARTDQGGDVRSLAALLETAVTGLPPGGPPPSESIDGFPRALDRILRHGQSGHLDAADLEKALLAAPTPRLPQPGPTSTSRRLLLVASVLVVIAIGLVALGRLFIGGGPILPVVPTTSLSSTTTQAPTTTAQAEQTVILAVTSFDPFGEAGENDALLPNLTDRDSATSWRTETYQAPLDEIKPGLGIRFEVRGTPATMTLVGFTTATSFEVRWSQDGPDDIEGWERVMTARSPEGVAVLTLPARVDGHWLLWMTGLPEVEPGSYSSSISEVRFSP